MEVQSPVLVSDVGNPGASDWMLLYLLFSYQCLLFAKILLFLKWKKVLKEVAMPLKRRKGQKTQVNKKKNQMTTVYRVVFSTTVCGFKEAFSFNGSLTIKKKLT